MKISAKQIIQLILIFSLTFPLFPSITKFASARDQTQSDIPVSFNITASNREGLELVLTAPSYQITEIQIQDQLFDNVIVPGTVPNSAPGELQLPVANELIAVPPRAVVTLEILDDSDQLLSGRYNLATSPYPARLDEANPTQRWDYSKEVQIQQSENTQKSLHPSVRIAEEAWLRDQRVVRLEYSPFVYNSDTGYLVWYPSVTVKVHFEFPFGKPDSSHVLQQPKVSDSSFETMLSTSLLNYEQAEDWRADSLPVEVLVTPPETGDRYRISIQEDGIYKLTYDDLFAANPAITVIDPNRLHMTSQGEDVAIFIHDEGDGDSFDPGDFIIFYGQRFYGERLADLYHNENQHWQTFARQATDGKYYPDGWKPEFNEIMLEKYTDENIYWLFEDTSLVVRMDTANGNPDNNNDPVPYYRETVRAEESFLWKTTLFAGEDTWFWEIITKDNIFEFEANITSPTSIGDPVVIRSEFVSSVGNSNDEEDHHTKIYLNSNILGDATGFKWSGKSRYSFESTAPSTIIFDGTNTFAIEALTDTEFLNPSYYFDWFEIEYNRSFVAVDDAIIFTSPTTGLQKYQVGGFTSTSDILVLDITDPLLPLRVLNSATGSGQVMISLDHNDLSIAMNDGGKSLSSEQISYYQPPDWSAMTAGADYVFITHAELLNTTQVLADYRMAKGLSTAVVDINDLYNEFNFGNFHPIAIKNFLSYTFQYWDTKPNYALLVGDGHWNFHEHNLDKYGSGPQLIPPHLVWADPWQGEVDSANLLANIVGTDPFPDLMIARLPVNSPRELNAYIDKLIDYESTPYEDWQQNHIFVADNPDHAGNFTTYSENIVEQYIDPFNYASPLKIYQEDYGCVSSTSVECDNVRNALVDGINAGSLILNFIGHASLNRWSHERVFTPTQFPDLTNTGKLPVILSMTCLDGYWSGPLTSPGTSMIEELVREDTTGAIGAFSPTGLGVSTGHDLLHKGFYDSLINDGNWELGAAAQNSKLWLYQSGTNLDLLHTYTIFGDPALQIRNPINNKIWSQI